MTRSTWLVLGLSAAFAGGCSSSSDMGSGAGAFPAAPLSTFSSDSNGFQIALRTMPNQPPIVGPGSEAQLMITDSSGKPVDGLTVGVVPYMPVMGHGTPVATSVAAQGNGVYLVTNLAPSMPGDWELKLTMTESATDGGGAAVHATSPSFSVVQQ